MQYSVSGLPTLLKTHPSVVLRVHVLPFDETESWPVLRLSLLLENINLV